MSVKVIHFAAARLSSHVVCAVDAVADVRQEKQLGAIRGSASKDQLKVVMDN